MPFSLIKRTFRSKFPIPWKGNLDRSAVQNSPFLEGVATEGRRGSVGNTQQDLLEKTSAIGGIVR